MWYQRLFVILMTSISSKLCLAYEWYEIPSFSQIFEMHEVINKKCEMICHGVWNGMWNACERWCLNCCNVGISHGLSCEIQCEKTNVWKKSALKKVWNSMWTCMWKSVWKGYHLSHVVHMVFTHSSYVLHMLIFHMHVKEACEMLWNSYENGVKIDWFSHGSSHGFSHVCFW